MWMISALHQQWHLFVIQADELFGSFFDAMNTSPVCRVTCMIRRNPVLLLNSSGLNVVIPDPVMLLMYFQLRAFLLSGSSSSNWQKERQG
ncbi:hypothetical protein JYY64_004978 [Salmonella enterica subsp. houtenae serovar 50:g,z51:-]|nr:hypothetical protein [Salmonella enterica subsp. houtenae serovar 50:g,z51:-]